MQLVLVSVSYVTAFGDADFPVPLPMRTMILVLSPLVLLSVNATTVTIQNAAALLFPGWVRVTPVVGGGVEVMGQGILATAMLMLTFVIALLPAAAAFAATLWLLGRVPNNWIAGVLVAAVVLLAESWWAIRGLGRRFARLEPGAT